MKWVPVIGYEGLYSVNELGEVRSDEKTIKSITRKRGGGGTYLSVHHKKQRILFPRIKDGYAIAALSRDGKRRNIPVHRIVYCSFNNISLDYQGHGIGVVCHKNDIRSDNRLENLFYGTQMDNVKDMIMKKRDRRNHGHIPVSSKLNMDDVIAIRNRYEIGKESIYKIQKDYPFISVVNIWRAIVGRTYNRKLPTTSGESGSKRK